MDGYFGKRFVVPQSQVREIGKGAFNPIPGSHSGSEGENINYWHKPVDELLNHEIGDMLDEEFAKQLEKVGIVVGGPR
jgi:hypothetical protein